MTAAIIRIITMSAAVRVFVRRNPTLASWTRSFGRTELPRVITRALSVSSVRLKPDKVTHTGQVWLSAKLQTRFCVFDCYCSGNFCSNGQTMITGISDLLTELKLYVYSV